MAALALMAMAPSAGAQSIPVSAEIVAGCALAASTQKTGIDMGLLSFGSRPAVIATTVTASVVATGGGLMQFECTPGITMNVSIDGGLHLSSGQRRMGRNGGNTHVTNYTLYKDAGRTLPIGVNSPTGVTVPASGTVALPVYGSATVTGTGMPGTYTDTVQITLTW